MAKTLNGLLRITDEAEVAPIYIPIFDKRGRISVCSIFSLSRTKAKELASRDDFPKPIKIASNCLRYRLDEVVQWMENWRRHQIIS